MKSAIKLVIGLSAFGAVVSAAGCSSSSSPSDATGGSAIVIGSAGNSNSSGGSTASGGGSTGSSDLPVGIAITPVDGWVDSMSNPLGIQGALFSYEDDTTKPTVTDTIASGMNCMQGTAAKVDLKCTIVAPATDCYGTIWGAAMGLNLNQPNVMDGGVSVGGTPIAFDGTKGGITGFAFDVSGDTVPGQANFRFLINDTASNQYCTPTTKGIKKGPNVFYLKDLVEECWQASKPTDLTGDTATNNIVKIAWQVVTSSTAAIPFNFCIDNIEALTSAPTD